LDFHFVIDFRISTSPVHRNAAFEPELAGNRYLGEGNHMRRFTTVVLLGLGGACLGSVAWADQAINPSMLHGNTALSVGSLASSQPSLQLNSVSGVSGALGGAQAMSSSMPAESAGASPSHALGTAVSRPDPTSVSASGPGGYAGQLSTTLGSLGATGTAPQTDGVQVPSALHLSATGNAVGTGLAGATPSDRALNK
jgi:hypothetical protein